MIDNQYNRTKSSDAFKTIGEVANALSVPTHVLRFWEEKFPQISPRKANGRRYYSTGDVALLASIKVLLYERGLTIKGAQQYLSNENIHHSQSSQSNISPSQQSLQEILSLLKNIKSLLTKQKDDKK